MDRVRRRPSTEILLRMCSMANGQMAVGKGIGGGGGGPGPPRGFVENGKLGCSLYGLPSVNIDGDARMHAQ
jgi:hypothetical protein